MRITRKGMKAAKDLQKTYPSIDINKLAEICSILVMEANALDRINEQECNTGITDATEQQSARHMAYVREVVKENLPDTSVRFQGDPRGLSIYLITPDQRFNTLGGAESGYGIVNVD